VHDLRDLTQGDLVVGAAVEPGGARSAVGGHLLGDFRGADTTHLKRSAIPPRPLPLQSSSRHRWGWPDGASTAPTNQKRLNARSQVRANPPHPWSGPAWSPVARPSGTSSTTASGNNSIASVEELRCVADGNDAFPNGDDRHMWVWNEPRRWRLSFRDQHGIA